MAKGANTSEFKPKVKLYIEGVLVPFTQITVTTNRSGLPTATISVPPLPGLTEIARYYQPKVHIFYRDLDYVGSEDKETGDDYHLLFSGIIAQIGYHRARGTGAGVNLSFQCVHRNVVMEGITFQFTGRGTETLTDPNANDTTASPLNSNSQHAMLLSLKGVRKNSVPVAQESSRATESNTTALLESMQSRKDEYFERLQGMPGVFLNYWNRLKRDTYVVAMQGSIDTESMTDMYIPLVEAGDPKYSSGKGLRFFDRASGHPFLEGGVEGQRADLPKEVTTDISLEVDKVVVPPSLREALADAGGSHLSAVVTQMGVSFSGERGDFPSMLNMMAGYFSYEVLTLSSPARGKDGMPAVETVFKPSLDNYYAPKCNILTPNMYEAIQISENTFATPTRIVCNHTFGINQDEMPLKFRSPQTVREAIANGRTIQDSLSLSRDRVGRYEWGRGVRSQMMGVPPWLQYLYASQHPSNPNATPLSSSGAYAAGILNVFRDQYGENYPPELTPWDAKGGLNQYQRILMASLDQLYAKTLASMRSGTASGPFNPYVVPGYPMDIIGSDETSPSYHAMCDSVTHTITERSINTAYTISSAMTYEEIYSYFLPPISPWLMVQLGMDKELSIVDNPSALEAANQFYAGVLGVGAAAPEALHDFSTGRPKPIYSETAEGPFVYHPNGFESKLNPQTHMELNPNLTVQGSLNLARREIETLSDYEEAFGIEFIDVDYGEYPNTYIDESVGIADTTKGKLEPGRSPLLDYVDPEVSVSGSGGSESTAEPVVVEESEPEPLPESFSKVYTPDFLYPEGQS